MFAASCGSGSSTGAQPEAAWAESRAAQSAFRTVTRAWVEATPQERLDLEAELVDFLNRHHDDAGARVVRMYLAWVYVQKGRLDEARRLSRAARKEHPGMVGDFATVIEGAILARRNEPARALALLEPLRGKLIDPVERVLYGGELVRAALAASQYEPAVAYMVDWLSQTPSGDVESVQAEIDFVLKDAPPALLEAGTTVLASEAALDDDTKSARAQARAFLSRTIRVRLVRVALAERDVDLARRLLDATPPSFKRDPSAEALSRLASEGYVEPRIHGRALGVVLELDAATSRRRSAQTVAGLSRALGLPASAADPESIRLVTRDASEGVESIRESLASLAGEGAGILVAAVTAEGAREASAFAEEAKIPVLLLSDTAELPSSLRFTFVLGADPRSVSAALSTVMAPRREGEVAVVEADVLCASPGIAGQPRFPVAEWKRAAVDGLLLLGDAECARDAISEANQAGLSPALAFGLECGEIHTVFQSRRTFIVSAGVFPSGATGSVPEDMRAWQTRTGAPPTWFEALGHDAALLAKTVLSSFPLERVDAKSAVTELHRKARDALAEAEAGLWTTRGRGFAGQRRLPRELTVLKLNDGGR